MFGAFIFEENKMKPNSKINDPDQNEYSELSSDFLEDK